jgi:hypothetical protein
MICRLAIRAVALATFFVVGVGVGAAVASTSWTYREATLSDLLGASAYIEGNSFNAPNHSCVLYGLVLVDESGTSSWTQVETGVVECTNLTIDGTCTSGHGFAETYQAGTYTCWQGDAFSHATAYAADIERYGASTVIGTILGTSASAYGYLDGHVIVTDAWGEVSGGSTCPSSAGGSFLSWQKLRSSTGWTYVTGGSGTTKGLFGPCWTLGSLSSTGDFSVS